MNNDQYQKELQAISERYSEAKDSSEIVKLELWLTPGYQLDQKELKEAREMVEAYFALGTDEGRVYYEDMYSPVDESIYAEWTEIHWKKFQLMGALDKKIGTWNSFGNGVVEAVPFWGTLSDLTMKTQAGLRGYEFEELCLSQNIFINSHTQHPFVTFGGNLTGGLLTYELAAGAARSIPGLSQRISSISGRLSVYPILNRIGQDHISNMIGATVIDMGVLTLPGAIGDIAEGKSPGNVFRNAGLDIGRNLLFNIGGEAVSGALGALLKKGKSGKYSEAEIESIIDNLKGNGFKNNSLRQAYENEVAGLKAYGEELLASGMSEEQVARTLNQARRDLGTKYKNATPQPLRDYIYEVNMGRYGDKLGLTYDWLVSERGATSMEIINSSSRPNSNIDKLLSGFEEWLRRQ